MSALAYLTVIALHDIAFHLHLRQVQAYADLIGRHVACLLMSSDTHGKCLWMGFATHRCLVQTYLSLHGMQP